MHNALHLPAGGVSAVVFDFDGTLVFHEPDSFDIVSTFCTDIGQPLDGEAKRQGRRMRHGYFVDPVIRQQLESLTPGQFWHHFNRYLLGSLDIQGDLDDLAHELTARFEGIQLDYQCPQAGCLTLSELRRRGYALGLITNRGNVERFYDLMQAMGLGTRFDLTLASGEVGIRKPERGIFDIALSRLGTAAAQTMYVGDNYWTDIVGAEGAGMVPVLLDPYHLFPEARCLVLEHLDELLPWLP